MHHGAELVAQIKLLGLALDVAPIGDRLPLRLVHGYLAQVLDFARDKGQIVSRHQRRLRERVGRQVFRITVEYRYVCLLGIKSLRFLSKGFKKFFAVDVSLVL